MMVEQESPGGRWLGNDGRLFLSRNRTKALASKLKSYILEKSVTSGNGSVPGCHHHLYQVATENKGGLLNHLCNNSQQIQLCLAFFFLRHLLLWHFISFLLKLVQILKHFANLNQSPTIAFSKSGSCLRDSHFPTSKNRPFITNHE